MRTITFEEADPLLSWNSIADALHSGHQLPKAQIGDLLLQVEPNAMLNRGAWIPGLGMVLKSMSVFPQNGSANPCLLYTSPSPRDKRQSRMPSSA